MPRRVLTGITPSQDAQTRHDYRLTLLQCLQEHRKPAVRMQPTETAPTQLPLLSIAKATTTHSTQSKPAPNAQLSKESHPASCVCTDGCKTPAFIAALPPGQAARWARPDADAQAEQGKPQKEPESAPSMAATLPETPAEQSSQGVAVGQRTPSQSLPVLTLGPSQGAVGVPSRDGAVIPASRRSKTVEPKPRSDIIRASEGTRSIKIRLYHDAMRAGAPLQTSERATALEMFLRSGDFRRHHDDYHRAREGRALNSQGEPFSGPLQAPACGKWVWSLSAALVTGPHYPCIWNPDRSQHAPTGDADECCLYALYREHLDMIADWANLATCLHELLRDVPPAVYYRLDWRQSWVMLEAALGPWLQFHAPLSLEDATLDPPMTESGLLANGKCLRSWTVLHIHITLLSQPTCAHAFKVRTAPVIWTATGSNHVLWDAIDCLGTIDKHRRTKGELEKRRATREARLAEPEAEHEGLPAPKGEPKLEPTATASRPLGPHWGAAAKACTDIEAPGTAADTDVEDWSGASKGAKARDPTPAAVPETHTSIQAVIQELEDIVRHNDKARFELQWKGQVLQRLTLDEPLRQAIHGEPNAAQSGMRSNAEITVHLDIKAAIQDGFAVFMTVSGSWMAAGRSQRGEPQIGPSPTPQLALSPANKIGDPAAQQRNPMELKDVSS
ncbi:unnamed protein product [Symbiodinium microadriaticum]|nr:unnamed protein product [Symbiodinium microadriaticum]